MENNIIGQDNLIKLLDKFTLDTCPRTILLEGSKGSGRHLISKYIANTLNIDVVDISKELTLEVITNAILSVEPCLYVIDTAGISVKNQNVILKFLEEPTKNCIIVLITENKSMLLDTVINRCYVLTLQPYSKEMLSHFTNNEDVLAYATTPGEVVDLESAQFDEYKRISNLIITSIHKASLSNTLSLSEKIKDNNMDLKLFLKVYLKTIVDFVKINPSEKYIKLYSLTNELIKKLAYSANQTRLFDKYLIELYELMSR